MSDSYKDYWSCVESTVKDVLEGARMGSDKLDLVHEEADGSYWVIYTHAAALVMRYSDNSDAYWDVTGESSIDCEGWSELVSKLAYYAFSQDVIDKLVDVEEEQERAL